MRSRSSGRVLPGPGARGSRAEDQAGVPVGEVPLVELMYPRFQGPVAVGGFPVRETLEGDHGDKELIAVHCS